MDGVFAVLVRLSVREKGQQGQSGCANRIRLAIERHGPTAIGTLLSRQPVETLGDGVLRFVITQSLFEQSSPHGALTTNKATPFGVWFADCGWRRRDRRSLGRRRRRRDLSRFQPNANRLPTT